MARGRRGKRLQARSTTHSGEVGDSVRRCHERLPLCDPNRRALELLPGDGTGFNVRVQVFLVADAGDAVQVAMPRDGMRVALIGK